METNRAGRNEESKRKDAISYEQMRKLTETVVKIARNAYMTAVTGEERGSVANDITNYGRLAAVILNYYLENGMPSRDALANDQSYPQVSQDGIAKS